MEASTSRKQVAEETPTSVGALTTPESLATARTPGTAISERIKGPAGLTATVSFSDDEFVIGPCRSTATHDNDRK